MFLSKSQISGERLQDHWSSGFVICPLEIKVDSNLGFEVIRLVVIVSFPGRCLLFSFCHSRRLSVICFDTATDNSKWILRTHAFVICCNFYGSKIETL